MKRILLAVTAILISTTAFSQYKGNVLLGGGVLFDSENDPNSADRSRWIINPGVGYCFSDNWAAGIFANYDRLKSVSNSAFPDKTNLTFLGMGPFLRYTQTLSNTFFVYGQLELAYYSGKRTDDDGTTIKTTKSTMYSASFFPMVGVNVHNGFNLNFGIGGVGFQSEQNSVTASPTSRAMVNFGKMFQFTIGKFFGRRKQQPLYIQ